MITLDDLALSRRMHLESIRGSGDSLQVNRVSRCVSLYEDINLMWEFRVITCSDVISAISTVLGKYIGG